MCGWARRAAACRQAQDATLEPTRTPSRCGNCPNAPARPSGYETLYGADYVLNLGGAPIQLEWLYSEGKRAGATHWFAARLQIRTLPLQPELAAAYQTAEGRLSWRVALQQQAGERARINFALRGKAGRIEFVAFGLQGEL
jgi:hypothetical protein